MSVMFTVKKQKYIFFLPVVTEKKKNTLADY